jgi:hypothetical protein
MRLSIIVSLLIIMAFGMKSCQVFQSVSYKTMGINETGVIQHPVLAELEVLPTKITQSVVVKNAKTFEEVKALAMAQVIRDTKSDVLVEPKFETKRKGAKLTVTVTAYPALYRNFRSISPEDSYILEHVRYNFKSAELSEGTFGIKPGKKKR